MSSIASSSWRVPAAAALPALLPLLFAAVLVWDLLFVGNLELGGASVAPETFALAALCGYALLRAALHAPSRDELLRQAVPMAAVCLAFWATMALVWLLHGADAAAGAGFLRVPVYALYAAAAGALCVGSGELRAAARGIVVAAALLCIAVAVFGLPAADQQGGAFRWTLINPMAHAVGLGVAVAYGLCAGRSRGLGRTLLLLLMAAVPVYARSRGAMVATLAACAVVWWHWSRPAVRSFWLLVHGSLFLVAVLLLASGLLEDTLVRSGLLEQSGSSNWFRLQICVLGARMFASAPLAGCGLGSMADPPLSLLDGLNSLPRGNLVTSDNDYARLLAETGMCGAAAVLLLARMLWRRRPAAVAIPPATADDGVAALRVTGAAIATFLLVLAMFEHVFSDPTGWLLFGLAFCCMGAR